MAVPPRLMGRFSDRAGEFGREPLGYEKLTELRLPGRSSSGTVVKLWIRLCVGDPDALSRSIPDPRAFDRGGEAGGDRMDGSRLAARRGGSFLDAYWLGSEGNGGTSTGKEGEAPELVDGRLGDESRKVLAVIELELFVLRSVPPTLAERRPFIGLAGDSVEARRWTIRFVCTFSTFVGVGVRFRSAAAAAAEERLLEEGCDFRNAWLAADCADCDAGVDSG